MPFLGKWFDEDEALAAVNAAQAVYGIKGESANARKNLYSVGYERLSLDSLGFAPKKGQDKYFFVSNDKSAVAEAYIRGNELIVAFRGTDGLSDLPHDIKLLYSNTYYKLFDPFLKAIANYASSFSSIDITFVGHSLGGAAVNQLMQYSSNGYGGAFNTAKFIAFESPHISTNRAAKSVNIGFENDPIYKLADLLPLKRSLTTDFIFIDVDRSLKEPVPSHSLHNTQKLLYAIDHVKDKTIDYGEVGFDLFSMLNPNSVIYFDRLDGLLDLSAKKDVGYIIGEDRNDRIIGTNDSDYIFSSNGNDIVNSGDGSDIVYGGAGRDVLRGGDQNDQLYGGSGDDVLEGGDGDDSLFGGPGYDRVDGGNGYDKIYFNQRLYAYEDHNGSYDAEFFNSKNIESIILSNEDDRVWINNKIKADTIFCGSGNDYFVDTRDGDSLSRSISVFGQDGDDTIIFEKDTAKLNLDGGNGNDMLWFSSRTRVSGGAGEDTFQIQFGARDVYVADFEPGVDHFRVNLGGQNTYFEVVDKFASKKVSNINDSYFVYDRSSGNLLDVEIRGDGNNGLETYIDSVMAYFAGKPKLLAGDLTSFDVL